MRRCCVWRARHRPSCDGGNIRLLVHGRFGVHALLGTDVAKAWILRRLHEDVRGGTGACVVADEVEVLALGGGDAERLLHQAVGLVAVSVWSILVGAVFGAAVRLVARLLRGKAVSSTLALHLAVGQEAPRHSACAPRFPVRPPAHAGFPLVPDEDRAGLDLLALLLGQAALHARQQAGATGLEEDDGIVGGAHVAVICLHGGHVSRRGAGGAKRWKRGRGRDDGNRDTKDIKFRLRQRRVRVALGEQRSRRVGAVLLQRGLGGGRAHGRAGSLGLLVW